MKLPLDAVLLAIPPHQLPRKRNEFLRDAAAMVGSYQPFPHRLVGVGQNGLDVAVL